MNNAAARDAVGTPANKNQFMNLPSNKKRLLEVFVKVLDCFCFFIYTRSCDGTLAWFTEESTVALNLLIWFPSKLLVIIVLLTVLCGKKPELDSCKFH